MAVQFWARVEGRERRIVAASEERVLERCMVIEVGKVGLP